MIVTDDPLFLFSCATFRVPLSSLTRGSVSALKSQSWPVMMVETGETRAATNTRLLTRTSPCVPGTSVR